MLPTRSTRPSRPASPARGSRPSRRVLLSLAVVTVAGSAIAGGSSLASAGAAARTVTRSAVALSASGSASGLVTRVGAMTDAGLPIDTAETTDPTDVVGPDVTTSCPAMDLTAINSEQQELAAYLTEHDIAYTIDTSDGVDWVVPTGTDEATMNALDDYYWEKFPMPADMIEQINSGTQKLVEFLQSKGFAVGITTDRHGVTSPDFDPNDETLRAALDEFYQTQFDELDGDGGMVFAMPASGGVVAIDATALPTGIDPGIEPGTVMRVDVAAPVDTASGETMVISCGNGDAPVPVDAATFTIGVATPAIAAEPVR